jgi:hypothetical protein
MPRLILRFHATYLGLFALAGFLFMDMAAVVNGTGPAARLLGNGDALLAAIGFIEAHGLAFFMAVLLWRAPVERAWHVTGAATAALLGVCNLAFWNLFVVTDSLAMGYVTTGLHLTVAALQTAAALTASREAVEPVARVRAGVA